MKGWKGLACVGVFLAGGMLTGCKTDPTSPDEETDPPAVSASIVATTVSGADVYRMPDGAGEPVGSSWIRRNKKAIRMHLNTDLLPRRHAATVWAVIFNNPAACAGSPCAAADLDNDAVQGSVVWAAGAVTRRHGVRFRGRVRLGDTSGALRGPGLLDPSGAEVHFLIRSHGPLIRGMVREQITTASGGCEGFITPELPTLEGQCSDVAFAIHLP